MSSSIFAANYRKLHQAYCKIKCHVANNLLLLTQREITVLCSLHERKITSSL